MRKRLHFRNTFFSLLIITSFLQTVTVRAQFIAKTSNVAMQSMALTFNALDTSRHYTHISKNIRLFHCPIDFNTRSAIRFNLQIGVDVLTKDRNNYKIHNINALQFLS